MRSGARLFNAYHVGPSLTLSPVEGPPLFSATGGSGGPTIQDQEYPMGYAPWLANTGWDGVEMARNRRHREALRLLGRIVDEVGTQSFTAHDLLDAVNPIAKQSGWGSSTEHWTTMRYGRSHLDALLAMGFLDRQGGSYEVVRFEA